MKIKYEPINIFSNIHKKNIEEVIISGDSVNPAEKKNNILSVYK